MHAGPCYLYVEMIGDLWRPLEQIRLCLARIRGFAFHHLVAQGHPDTSALLHHNSCEDWLGGLGQLAAIGHDAARQYLFERIPANQCTYLLAAQLSCGDRSSAAPFVHLSVKNDGRKKSSWHA